MITGLLIENFKCFSALKLPFGRLTLLTGFNSAGKSTATQPLLLLAQRARFEPPGATMCSLNGPLVRLGTVGDVVPAGASETSARVGLMTYETEAFWKFSGRAGERRVAMEGPDVRGDRKATRLNHAAKLGELLRGLTYISAVREGAGDSYPMPDMFNGEVPDVGVDGRYAAYWYDRLVDEEVPVSRRHPDEPATSMRKQADAWFSSLFPNAQVTVQHIAQVAAESLQFRSSDIGDWRRPANVGYGFTYVFPILVALLVAREGDQLVVIDSPEAHLHPRAQSQMGRMLATFAAAGVQLVVETHSDHLLNGVRLAVKEGTLSPDSLAIHFFSGAQDSTGVTSPAISREGQLSDWPIGFFDQAERDLAQISGWA